MNTYSGPDFPQGNGGYLKEGPQIRNKLLTLVKSLIYLFRVLKFKNIMHENEPLL